MDWSPNGRHVVNDVVRLGRGQMGLAVRSADAEMVREWTFDLTMQRWIMRWTSNGNNVVFTALDNHGRRGLQSVDLKTGEWHTIWRFDHPWSHRGPFDLSLDGSHTYYARGLVRDGVLDENFTEIVERDLISGSERSIHPVEEASGLELSADGTWLAFYERYPQTSRNTVQIVPVSGGEPRVLFEATGEEYQIGGIAGWTPDGQSVLFTLERLDETAGERVLELWRASTNEDVSAEMITPLHARPSVPAFDRYARGGVRLHPDGDQLLYRTGQQRGEIWAIDVLGKSSTRLGDGR